MFSSNLLSGPHWDDYSSMSKAEWAKSSSGSSILNRIKTWVMVLYSAAKASQAYYTCRWIKTVRLCSVSLLSSLRDGLGGVCIFTHVKPLPQNYHVKLVFSFPYDFTGSRTCVCVLSIDVGLPHVNEPTVCFEWLLAVWWHVWLFSVGLYSLGYMVVKPFFPCPFLMNESQFSLIGGALGR